MTKGKIFAEISFHLNSTRRLLATKHLSEQINKIFIKRTNELFMFFYKLLKCFLGEPSKYLDVGQSAFPLNVTENGTTASARNENDLSLSDLSISLSSLFPLSSSQEALVMVKTWSVPIRWKITPCYIPLMRLLHAEPFHQECWNTEREEAVELHPNRHHNQRPGWRPALYPTLTLSQYAWHMLLPAEPTIDQVY